MSRGVSFRVVLALAAVAAVVAAILFLPVREGVAAVVRWAGGRGAWTGVLLSAVWAPAAVLAVPGSVLTLATGFVLGVGWGTLVVSIGSTVGAIAAFLVGRALGRERVKRRIADRPRFRAVDAAVEREGIKVVVLTRLSPLFPYNVQNYAYAMTGIGFRDFVLGSWIGMLPGTVLYVYLGASARTLAAAATGQNVGGGPELALFAVGLAATIAVTVLLTRASRRALEERIEERRSEA